MTVASLVSPALRQPWPSPLADHHVHSTFSDGASSPAENVAAAVRAGLRSVVLVDHVRASTTWLPAFVGTVRDLRDAWPLEVRCGVETKVLDCDGRLDLPDQLDGVEIILVADHQVPTPRGPVTPDEVARAIREGRLPAGAVVGWLLDATAAALDARGTAITAASPPMRLGLAHLFSLLPKVGLSEDDVPDAGLASLAHRTASSGAWLELNEKWRCPGPRVVAAFVAAGVPLVLGSDAHDSGAVGRFDHSLQTIAAGMTLLRDPGHDPVAVGSLG